MSRRTCAEMLTETVRFKYNLCYRLNVAAFIARCLDRVVPTQLFAKPLARTFKYTAYFVLG
jgi:hypothetical protein